MALAKRALLAPKEAKRARSARLADTAQVQLPLLLRALGTALQESSRWKDRSRALTVQRVGMAAARRYRAPRAMASARKENTALVQPLRAYRARKVGMARRLSLILQIARGSAKPVTSGIP